LPSLHTRGQNSGESNCPVPHGRRTNTRFCVGDCCVQRSSSHTVPRATRPATVCRWGSYQSSGRRDATRAPVSPPPFTSRTGTGSAHGRLVAVCLFRQAHHGTDGNDVRRWILWSSTSFNTKESQKGLKIGFRFLNLSSTTI
jgi:hypothetical protein